MTISTRAGHARDSTLSSWFRLVKSVNCYQRIYLFLSFNTTLNHSKKSSWILDYDLINDTNLSQSSTLFPSVTEVRGESDQAFCIIYLPREKGYKTPRQEAEHKTFSIVNFKVMMTTDKKEVPVPEILIAIDKTRSGGMI